MNSWWEIRATSLSRVVALGHDAEVASAKPAERAPACGPQRPPGPGAEKTPGSAVAVCGAGPPGVPLRQEMESMARVKSTRRQCYLLRPHDTHTVMNAVVTNGCHRLEPGPLASLGLRLHEHDLHNLVCEGHPQKEVSELQLPDAQRKETDIQGFDHRVLDPAAWLDDKDPSLSSVYCREFQGLSLGPDLHREPSLLVLPKPHGLSFPDAWASRPPTAPGSSTFLMERCLSTFLQKTAALGINPVRTHPRSSPESAGAAGDWTSEPLGAEQRHQLVCHPVWQMSQKPERG